MLNEVSDGRVSTHSAISCMSFFSDTCCPCDDISALSTDTCRWNRPAPIPAVPAESPGCSDEGWESGGGRAVVRGSQLADEEAQEEVGQAAEEEGCVEEGHADAGELGGGEGGGEEEVARDGEEPVDQALHVLLSLRNEVGGESGMPLLLLAEREIGGRRRRNRRQGERQGLRRGR